MRISRERFTVGHEYEEHKPDKLIYDVTLKVLSFPLPSFFKAQRKDFIFSRSLRLIHSPKNSQRILDVFLNKEMKNSSSRYGESE